MERNERKKERNRLKNIASVGKICFILEYERYIIPTHIIEKCQTNDSFEGGS